MRPVPILLALALLLAAPGARSASTDPTLPPTFADTRRPGVPLLRPGQKGVVAPAGTAPGSYAWDLRLRKGDRVSLEVVTTGGATLAAAPLAEDPGLAPAATDVVAAAATDDGQGAWRARVEVTAPRKGTWRVAVRPAGEAPVSHELSARCVSGPSCKGAATGTCGPDGHPWWLRTPLRLLSDPPRWEGHPVRVRAKVRADLPKCTARACPLKACCNTCVAALVTGPSGLRGMPGMKDAGLRLEGLFCRGSDCAWREACPFAPGQRVTAWGHVHTDDLGTRLEVHGACGPLPRAKQGGKAASGEPALP